MTDEVKIQRYYQALLDRDPSYTGIFYVAVKTTAIFCIATCRARKPKFENVEFYTSYDEPMASGFRPCKVCRPTENADQAPPQVAKAITLLNAWPQQKLTDALLKHQGISPEQVRRWFKQHHGITFQQYQRMHRINNATTNLKQGKNVTESAFNSGYDSLSGFGYSYKKVLGNPPNQQGNDSVILINRLTTPLGPMLVCATNKGICLLEFVDRKSLESEFKELKCKLNARIIAGENQHITHAKQQLTEYFANQRSSFSVPLDLQGTPFQLQVWQGLLAICYGKTAYYQQQAKSIGKPTAVSAVAAANQHNKVAIIVPCHRLVCKSGKPTGYGGSVERKEWLLDHEQS